MMTDWSAVLADAFNATAQPRGDSGDSGDTRDKPLETALHLHKALDSTSNGSVVTAVTPDAVVTTVTTVASNPGDEGRSKSPVSAQCSRESATTVPTATTDIRSLGTYGRLRLMGPLDCFSAEAWRQLLIDVEGFLQKWSGRQELSSWSEIDLVGVHPSAPAVRFDAMGLLLVVRGGRVTGLSDQSATIETKRGSRLIYRKCKYRDAVVPWDLARVA